MGRKNRKHKQPPHVALSWDMLNSGAYKSLNYAPAKALPYFLGKIKRTYRDPQRYLYDFHLSYSEGKTYGFAYSTFSKIIKELIAKGFIDPEAKGGLRSDGKSYNLFRLSRRWEKYGTQDFEPIDWKCFCPKPRLKATPKREIHNSQKRNKKSSNSKSISQTEVVEGVLT